MFFCNATFNDANTILLFENDKENADFIISNTKEEHQKLILHPDVDYFIIKVDNKIVGYTILHRENTLKQSLELKRIVIFEKGKGYGRKAIKKIKDYCFYKLQFQKLWLDVFEKNKVALKLYESEGFSIDETETIDINSRTENLIFMSIIINNNFE